jgi:hypothetical protein
VQGTLVRPRGWGDAGQGGAGVPVQDLVLVSATVEAAGGSVAFGEAPGGGARLTLCMPRAEAGTGGV